MNSVQLVGRLTRDPDIRYTDSGTSIARFTLAADRRFKQEGGQTADFVSCVAFGKTAEFLEKYFCKGMRMGLNGRVQTGSYTNQDGNKVYATDVVADSVEFVESKRAQENDGDQGVDRQENSGFMSIPDGIDDEIPFN